MKNRLLRLGAVLAATALAMVGVTAVAAPANAAGTCSIKAPSKLAITTPYRAVTLSLGADCAASGTVYASWDLYHPTKGWNDIAIFDGTTSDIWDAYDWDLSPARYSWRPSLAHDADYNDVTQNSPTTDIRYGSWAGVTTSRSGSYVTIKTSSARYSESADGYVRWGGTGVRGTLQYWGTNGWTGLKYVYPAANGYSTTTFYAPKGKSYRVVFPDTATIWGSTSASSWR